MKVKDVLSFSVQELKPRCPNQGVLAAKKNAAGPHGDKKREDKNGSQKHKGSFSQE